jgi:hypothetical protein
MIIDDIAFRGLLAKGEEIKYVAHVHPFVIYPQLLKVIFFGMIMPAGGYFLFPPFYLAWAVWTSVGILSFFYRLLQWYLDAWVVTNHGIIDQDWGNPFNRSTTRIEFGNIEGITNQTKGFWGTILRFGFIQVEHISGEPVVLNHVSRPRKLEREILKYQQDFVQKQTMSDHGKLKDLLTTLLRSSNKNA